MESILLVAAGPRRQPGSYRHRWYETGQLDQARLVAALRQIGVPLAQIRPLLDLDAAAASSVPDSDFAVPLR